MIPVAQLLEEKKKKKKKNRIHDAFITSRPQRDDMHCSVPMAFTISEEVLYSLVSLSWVCNGEFNARSMGNSSSLASE